MAEDMEKRENTSFLGSSLVHRSSLERRLIFMKSYSRKTRVSKLATMVLSMAFVLCSAVSSYAASVEVSEIHDSIYKATDPVVRVYDEDGNEVEAHYFTAEDWAETNVEYEDGLELNPRVKSAGSFVWAIKANTRCCTPIISLSSGTRISVAATVRPSDSTFWMGVVLDSNGTGWYVDATEAAKYTFEVTSAGKYRVFVENRTSSKMNASGSYNF
jgi:hypothetical protein